MADKELVYEFIFALSEYAPDIAYAGNPRQFIDSIMANCGGKKPVTPKTDIERRVERLEIEHRRLGPQPESEEWTKERDEVVARLVEQVKPEVPPVDRSARVLSDGSPETPDHREINPATGQQKGYIVLTAEERTKGFVRPVRRTYKHKVCGTTTTMAQSIAETYARDPEFYSGTFCCYCRSHFPLNEFVWDGTNEQVGS